MRDYPGPADKQKRPSHAQTDIVVKEQLAPLHQFAELPGRRIANDLKRKWLRADRRTPNLPFPHWQPATDTDNFPPLNVNRRTLNAEHPS